MPTNLFDQPGTLRSRVSRNLGFDPSSMIQSQYPQIMQDVEERRQMGRKKFTEDILTQQLAEAAQELQNRTAGYHLTQEQQYYNNPATSKMFQDYLDRMGFHTNAPVNNPNQIKDLMQLQSLATGQEAGREHIAGQLLQNQFPQPPTSDIEWARRTVGAPPVASTNAPPAVSPPSTPSPRGAGEVFMHEIAPYVGGTGTAMGGAKIGSRISPGWGTLVGTGLGYGLGHAATKMATGDLSQEDITQHPIAYKSGNILGALMALLSGGKAVAGKGGSMKGEAALPPGVIRIRPGAKATGVAQRFGKGIAGMFQGKPKAQPFPQANPPTPGLPPSMGNVPGIPNVPVIPQGSQAPGINDPALQRFLQEYFKKVNPPVTAP